MVRDAEDVQRERREIADMLGVTMDDVEWEGNHYGDSYVISGVDFDAMEDKYGEVFYVIVECELGDGKCGAFYTHLVEMVASA